MSGNANLPSLTNPAANPVESSSDEEVILFQGRRRLKVIEADREAVNVVANERAGARAIFLFVIIGITMVASMAVWIFLLILFSLVALLITFRPAEGNTNNGSNGHGLDGIGNGGSGYVISWSQSLLPEIRVWHHLRPRFETQIIAHG